MMALVSTQQPNTIIPGLYPDENEDVNAQYAERRVLTPGVDYINHANRIGVRLKSAALLSQRTGSAKSNKTCLSARSKSLPRRRISHPPTAQYIHDVVVPIQKSATENQQSRPITSHSYMGSKLKTHLPDMKPASARPSTCRSTTLSVYMDLQSATETPCPHGTGRKWNKSEQAVRFEMEQDMKANSQFLKRISEIRPHRVDRMYYMSGNKMRPGSKYHVDDEELVKLRELSKARKEAKHYGRGLSAGRGRTRYTPDHHLHTLEVPPFSANMMSVDGTSVARVNPGAPCATAQPLIDQSDSQRRVVPTPRSVKSEIDSVSLVSGQFDGISMKSPAPPLLLPSVTGEEDHTKENQDDVWPGEQEVYVQKSDSNVDHEEKQDLSLSDVNNENNRMEQGIGEVLEGQDGVIQENDDDSGVSSTREDILGPQDMKNSFQADDFHQNTNATSPRDLDTPQQTQEQDSRPLSPEGHISQRPRSSQELTNSRSLQNRDLQETTKSLSVNESSGSLSCQSESHLTQKVDSNSPRSAENKKSHPLSAFAGKADTGSEKDTTSRPESRLSDGLSNQRQENISPNLIREANEMSQEEVLSQGSPSPENNINNKPASPDVNASEQMLSKENVETEVSSSPREHEEDVDQKLSDILHGKEDEPLLNVTMEIDEEFSEEELPLMKSDDEEDEKDDTHKDGSKDDVDPDTKLLLQTDRSSVHISESPAVHHLDQNVSAVTPREVNYTKSESPSLSEERSFTERVEKHDEPGVEHNGIMLEEREDKSADNLDIHDDQYDINDSKHKESSEIDNDDTSTVENVKKHDMLNDSDVEDTGKVEELQGDLLAEESEDIDMDSGDVNIEMSKDVMSASQTQENQAETGSVQEAALIDSQMDQAELQNGESTESRGDSLNKVTESQDNNEIKHIDTNDNKGNTVTETDIPGNNITPNAVKNNTINKEFSPVAKGKIKKDVDPRDQIILDTKERKYWRDDPIDAKFNKELRKIEKRLEVHPPPTPTPLPDPSPSPSPPPRKGSGLSVASSLTETARPGSSRSSRHGKNKTSSRKPSLEKPGSISSETSTQKKRKKWKESKKAASEESNESYDILSDWLEGNFSEMTVDDALESEENKKIFQEKTSVLEPIPEDIQLDVYSFVSNFEKHVFGKKFCELDVDKKGYIMLDDLNSSMFKDGSESDLKYFMRAFDLNRDGQIHEREFIIIAALNHHLCGKKNISEDGPLELHLSKLVYNVSAYKDMFDIVDEDQDGIITSNEILLLLTTAFGTEMSFGKKLSDYILAVVDREQTGRIDFVDYLTFIPFFLQVHRTMLNKPVMVEDIEQARRALRDMDERRSNEEATIVPLEMKHN